MRYRVWYLDSDGELESSTSDSILGVRLSIQEIEKGERTLVRVDNLDMLV